MSRLLLTTILVLAVFVLPRPCHTHAQPDPAAAPATQARFVAVDLIVTPQDAALAAYQLDFRAVLPEDAEPAAIVGIEESDHPAFGSELYFDPAAIQQDRVILADFSLVAPEALPTEPVRVATVHLYLEPGHPLPDFTAHLTTAANAAGEPIQATLAAQLRAPEPTQED